MTTAAPANATMVRWMTAAIIAMVGAAAVILVVGRPASADRALPRFSAPPLRTGDPQLSDQLVRGQPTVLVFWASWCEPCQQEIPSVAAAMQSHRVHVIGVDTNDRRSDAAAFLASHHSATLPSAFDDTGSVAAAFGLYGLPATVFISSDGNVVTKHVGATTAHAINRFAQESNR